MPVSVGVVFDHRTRESRINRVTYDGRVYTIRRVTYHFPKRQGRTLLHTFCVEGEGVFFKLVLDTESLLWSLQEIRFHAVSTSAIQSKT